MGGWWLTCSDTTQYLPVRFTSSYVSPSIGLNGLLCLQARQWEWLELSVWAQYLDKVVTKQELESAAK